MREKKINFFIHGSLINDYNRPTDARRCLEVYAAMVQEEEEKEEEEETGMLELYRCYVATYYHFIGLKLLVVSSVAEAEERSLDGSESALDLPGYFRPGETLVR